MRLRDHEMFLNYFRMLPSRFGELLRLVGPSPVKKTTNLRLFEQEAAIPHIF